MEKLYEICCTIGLVLSILTLSIFGNVIYGQSFNQTFLDKNQSSNQTFLDKNQSSNQTFFEKSPRIAITLFGAANHKDIVMIFTKFGNTISAPRIFNVTNEYAVRGVNGTIEYIFYFPNQTIAIGEQLTGCAVILEIPKMICNSVYNSAGSRAEYIQLFLP